MKSLSTSKKAGIALLTIGFLSICLFAFADRIGFGRNGRIGAAQLLGMEIGIVLVLSGIYLILLKGATTASTSFRLHTWMTRVLNLPIEVWAIFAFLAVFLAFFIPPMFFSKLSIQYFNRYIPDAWITHIGYDIETTVSHIQAWMQTGESPYADRAVPYPPLALAFFAPFAILGYPAYFKLLALITFTVFIIATLILPYFLIHRDGRSILPLIFITGLFSYGFQFEIERGQFNMLAFSAALTAIYIFHYHPKFRYFSYLLFSFSVQLKLYPFIFILMLVDDWRDWKANLKRFAGLGLLNISLLFVLGIPLARDFVTQIISRQAGLVSSRNEDLSISGYVYSLTTNFFPQLAPHSAWIEKFILLILAACLFYLIVHAFIQKQRGLNVTLLVICTIGALIIPAASFDYKLPILAAPLILFLGQISSPESAGKKIAFIGFTILLTAAYWSTLYPFQVKPEFMARNFPALMVMMVSTIALHFLSSGKFNSIPMTESQDETH